MKLIRFTNERDNALYFLLNWLSLFYHWNSHCNLAENKMRKKIIAVDFDGVLHSFSSGWTNARNAPDPPVKGAIKWLKHLIRRPHLRLRCCPEYHIEVIIFSARIHHWGGKRTIKRWLRQWGLTKQEISAISFSRQKPNCQFLLDDRAVCFRGKFPSDHEIINFQPWHGQGIWGNNE